MTARNNPIVEATERDFIITRTFDAPRERVFKACTDPKHLAERWGPNGFANTFHEFDLSPGGAWRFVMHGPNGVDYKNESVFIEIVKPERIVFNHISPPRFQVTATLTEQAGKIKLPWRMLFESANEYNKVKSFAIDGNKQNLDRLNEHLVKMGESK